MNKTAILQPGQVSLRQLHDICRNLSVVELDPAARAGIDAAAAIVAKAAAGSEPVYGVNTGFGKLANTHIPARDTATLQHKLILSHCCGVDAPLPERYVHMMMVLKLISFGRGASGVRWEIVELLQAMLARGVYPLIPRRGSVGASGDLAPLAHLAAVLIGEGQASVAGKVYPGAQALRQAGLEPVTFGPKEGLAFINGTQFSTALALTGLFDAWRCVRTAVLTSALSTDAIMGSTAHLRETIHLLRGHQGQLDVAAALRVLLEGSQIRESHRADDDRVQDPYCIRCQPQVTGACIDLLRMAATTLTIEANAATDNPLIDTAEGLIISGGNFHAEPVAFAADQIALAIAETGAIAQRRIAMTVDPSLNFGLPAFLSPNPGLNSGFMIAEVASAALMSENKQRAAPCSVDSTPTSANQEDHVSMSAHAALRLSGMNDNLAQIVGIELLTGAQGVELRAPLRTGPRLCKALKVLREQVPALGEDRYMADDLAAAAALVRGETLLEAAGRDVFARLTR